MNSLLRRKPAGRTRSSNAARLGVVAVVALFLGRVAFAPVPVVALSSPQGDSAAAWPAGWSSYNFSTGSPVIDVENEPGISPDNTDLASNNGVQATPLMSFDHSTAFFRLRLKGDPRDAGKGGFDNATWLLQIATASDGVVRAVVGVNGKPVNTDFVYVANAPGTAVTNIYETPFDSSGGQLSAGARGLSDGAGQYYLDFQVPIARITAASGGSITASTPVKLFYGSSTAANLAVINKDHMTGSSVSFAGLAAITMGPAHLDVSKTRTLVSGPHPPEVGETTVYDLTLSVRNDGGNAATSVVATDTIPAGVTIQSVSTETGRISPSDQTVTWTVGNLPAGGPAVTATIRVSVAPLNADWNTTLSLNPGASFSATDAGDSRSVAATTGSLSAGPVGGNRFPDAVDDGATSIDDAAVTVNVLANDSDPDGSLVPSSVTITGAATKGSTSVNGTTGAITYTPNPGATGTDDFRYRVCDNGSPARCDIAVVTITLRHTPVANDDSATLAEDGSTTVDVVANDTDVDGNLDPTTVSVIAGPSHGTISINGTTGAITYTPSANYNGADSLTYQVCDLVGLCDTATLDFTVTALNDAPVANGDSATLAEDGSTTVDVATNDSDVDGNLDPTTVSVTVDPSHGTASVNGTTGAITYTPAADYNGPDSLTYEICDADDLCDTATVDFTVTALNDAPVAADDSATTDEDTAVIVDVVANDTDVDGNLLASTVFVTVDPSNGTASVNGTTGAIAYTPAADDNGADSLTYRICDSSGACDTATVSLTVTAVNDAPVANDDTAGTDEDTGVTVDVASNDTDVDGNLDPTSVTVVSGPTHGTISVNGTTGAITYTPSADYAGTDSLTYEICDASGACDTATVSVTVGGLNDAPVAVDDSATTDEDSAATVDVIANDTDVDGNLDPTSVTVVSGPTQGSASVDPVTGAITYAPAADDNGPDSLTYEICDTDGLCDTATVSFTVTAVNDAPVANGDSAAANEDAAVIVNVAANDTDADGNLDPTTVSVIAGPSHGTISVNLLTGAITYSPAADYAGADSLVYEICDTDDLCDTATVSLTVTPVNDAPVASDDTATTDEDAAVIMNVAANDTDVDGNLDPMTVSVQSGPTNGTASVDPVTGEITYTPDPDFNGGDSLTYQVCDTDDLCDTATVSFTIDPVNDAPVANDDTALLGEDASATVDVIANDTDTDGNLDPTSVMVTSPPANGTASVDPVTGKITYTPDADFNGSDNLTYEVCDSSGACDTATVDFAVDPVPDPPVAADDSATLDEDASVIVDVAANDSDVDGNLDATTVTILSGPANGTASVDLVTGAITYTPDADDNGADSLTYEICDLGGLCATATVSFTVTAVNDDPVAAGDSASTDEDTGVTVDVIANDTDVDGNLDASTVVVTVDPSHGSVSVNATTGEITYTPDADYNGPDSLTYEICDTLGLCDTATVDFTVTAVNDGPVAADDSATTNEDTAVTVNVVANDSDTDGNLDPTTVSVMSGPADGTASVDPVTGAITYAPDPDWFGSDSLTYEICDSSGACATATVSFMVDPVNDAPLANDDSATLGEDTGVTVDVIANDTDIDGNLDATTVSVQSGPSNGTVSVNGTTGAVTYTPTANHNGSDSLTYRVCDTNGLCDTGTVSFSVTAVNDDPVATDDSATTDEDAPTIVDVVANDTDTDGNLDPTTVSVLSGPANGTASVDPVTGSITYTPDPDFNSIDSLSYEVCDASGACDTAMVSFTVTAVNDEPVASDDTAGTDEDTAVTVDVVANDSDVDGNLDATTVTVISGPSSGTASVNPVTGEITYTPAAAYNGADSVQYQVCDTDGLCDTATVSITVGGVNDAPVANDDTDTLAEDASTIVDVVANDTDVDGNLDPTTVSVLSGPANGTASVDPVTGEITYTPDADYNGIDSLTYEICDTDGLCDTATVDLTVTAVNDAPVANDDTDTLAEDASTIVDVVANDTDADGNLDPTTVTVTSGPSNGTASVDSVTGEITYTPDPDWFGSDSLTYEICDSDRLCDTATVDVTVDPVNDAPVANDDSASTNEDAAVIVKVVANDSDADGDLDPTTVAVTSGPSSGTASVDSVTGEITYTPDPDSSGSDSLTYQVCDEAGACDTATTTFTVDPVNDAPVARDDTASVDAGDSVAIDVLANDTDIDGPLDPASVAVSAGPAHGSVTVNAVTGEITYSPDAGFAGVDSFDYRVCDSGGACATATVLVSVAGAPIAVADTAATVGGDPVAIDVLANDTDPDGTLDVGTLRVTHGPAHGSVAIHPVTGVITYTPDADASGPDTFTYEICDADPELVCSSAVVTIDVNGRPVATNDAVAVKSDGSVVIDPLANDHDLDGDLDPASVAITEPPAHGTVTVDPNTGRITYVPDPGYSGPDSFTYRVCDTGDPVACASGRVAVAVGAPATSSDMVQLLGDAQSRLAWPVALLVGILAATWVLAGARRRRQDATRR